MTVQFSFSNKKQYENNQKSFASNIAITEFQFKKLLRILKVFLSDPPNYHCRLYNDDDDEIYFCVSVLNKR